MRVILLLLPRVSVSLRRLSNLNPIAEPRKKKPWKSVRREKIQGVSMNRIPYTAHIICKIPQHERKWNDDKHI